MTTDVLVAAMMLGLVGAPHCVTMCGGIVALAQAPVAAPPRHRVRLPLAGSTRREASLVAAQSAGRLMTYAAGGAVVAGLSSLAAAVSVRSVQSTVEVVSGAVLLATALVVFGTLPASASIERLGVPIWRRLEPLAQRLLPLRNARAAVIFGAVWGFLPCGLVYSALALAATTGSLARGAMTMLAFGAGTLPALFAMGGFAGALRRFARHRVARLGVVVLLAVVGVYRLEHGLRQSPACAHCG